MSENINTNNKKIITRFAPSPTGFLHIGGARSALFNYLFSKQKEGKIILRIEDTDKERNKPEYLNGIKEAFEWLDLKFDEMKIQSENAQMHKKYLQKLIESDQAYFSKEEIVKEGQKEEVIRFKNPNKIVIFQDLIRGEIKIDTTDLGDFIIAKSLEEPIFHFSNVVDDINMNITHIIRGEEHLSNTARQILIWEAINERERPIYAHLSLILSENKEKLSKRKHGEIVSVEFYKKEGYLKEAFINFIAFLGWNPGGENEIYSLEELIKVFNLEKVQKSGAIFNVEKLNWYNKEYIKKQTLDEQKRFLSKYLNEYNLSDKILEKITPLIVDRISFYGEAKKIFKEGEFDFIFSKPVFNKENIKNIIWKKTNQENTVLILKDLIQIFKENLNLDINNKEEFENFWIKIYNFAEEKGKGDVLWPLRYSLSGKEKSIDPKSLISILELKESLERLENTFNLIN